MSPGIRKARPSDAAAITTLYNDYVRNSIATFDIAPVDVDNRRQWLDQFADTGPHQLFVAEEGDRLLGFAGTSRLNPRAAYAPSVETTIYLARDCQGMGLGTRLFAVLFDGLAQEAVHRAYALISAPNPASIALHQRFGFMQIGLRHQVGRKFERYIDVVEMEKRFA
ncbi:MAG: GNAT family N-acetyltransferase [Geminicoccaceae bacterium]